MIDSGEGARQSPSVLVVANDARCAGPAQEAAKLAGGRVTKTARWNDAAEYIASAAGLRLVIAEARGADDLVAAWAEPVAAAAEAAQVPLIVSFDEAQIDLVAGQLVDGGARLLCAPTLSDRVAAAAIALSTVWRPSQGVREQAAPFDGPPPAEPEVSAAEIRQILRARRLRGEQFGADGLFEDPAWDMLLDLLAARIEHRQVSVSSLCIAAAVAPTTALRWIGKLIETGLFERQPDTRDRRRAFIALTNRAVAAMAAYVAAAKRAGLPIA